MKATKVKKLIEYASLEDAVKGVRLNLMKKRAERKEKHTKKAEIHCWVVLDKDKDLILVSLADSLDEAREEAESEVDENDIGRVAKGVITYILL